LPPNSGSPECLSHAKQWLSSCQAGHSDCHRANENHAQLPTRVLRVGSDGEDASLYESRGETGRWATLSYCWGNGPKLILTKETHSDMMRGYPSEDFPATIRDAIITTSALGIPYLWVDALCIMQDSKSDWEQEAPKMSQIYTNAVLTIINANATAATSGIFRDRDRFGNGEYRGPTCSLPWRRTASKEYIASQNESSLALESIVIRGGRSSKTDWQGPGPDNLTSPWATRGWTLQEELLSWRTLTFMEKELLWGCPSTQRVKPNLGHVRLLPNKNGLSLSTSLPGLRTLSTPEIYTAWYTMAENYSKRKLTKDTDKLMAIVGLAKDAQNYITDTYCAGLWLNDLIAGLVWKFDAESWSDTEEYEVPPGSKLPTWGYGRLKANSDSRLPSWSWASINNEVYWAFKEQSAEKGTARYTEVAHVEERKIVYASDSPYGPVETCNLVLRGPTYSWSAAETDFNQTRPKLYHDVIRHLKNDGEYQARHKEHVNQTILVLQLAWIEELVRTYKKGEDDTTRLTCALLVLETVEEQEPEALINGAEIYRRVSQLYSGDVTNEKAVREAEWGMKSVRII
ncbi:HET-domain-containing protein, partial [Mollisia scopiformis]